MFEKIQNCMVCQKHRGELDVPGGLIYANELIAISHAQLQPGESQHYLGHLFVESKRHVPELADLSAEEAREVGLWVSRGARALIEILGVEHVYSFFMADKVAHVHVHVIGRYPGAPREFWGARVDEWPGAPRGDVAAMGRLAARVREYFKQRFSTE